MRKQDDELILGDIEAIQKALIDRGADDRRATIAAATFLGVLGHLPGQRNTVLATMRSAISQIENGTFEAMEVETPS